MRSALLVCACTFLATSFTAAAPRAQPVGEEIAVAMTSGRIDRHGQYTQMIVLIDGMGRRLKTLSRLAGRNVSDFTPAWSPDGKWLAFARSTDGRSSFHVYVMRADGSGVRQITYGRFDSTPAWSPDGRWIAYLSMGGLRIVHPNGKGMRLVPGTGKTGPTSTESYGSYPSWTPSGRLSYAFHAEMPSDWPESCRAASAHCGWVLTSDLNSRHRRAVVKGRDAHWSRDGRRIVFTLPIGGVATLAGGKRHVLGRGFLASWSPDGARIVYARMGMTAKGDAIWIMDADGRNPHRIMNFATEPAWRPSSP